MKFNSAPKPANHQYNETGCHFQPSLNHTYHSHIAYSNELLARLNIQMYI